MIAFSLRVEALHDSPEQAFLDGTLPAGTKVVIEAADPSPGFIEAGGGGLGVPLGSSHLQLSESLLEVHHLEWWLGVHPADLPAQAPYALYMQGQPFLSMVLEVRYEGQVVGEDDHLAILSLVRQAVGDIGASFIVKGTDRVVDDDACIEGYAKLSLKK